MENDLEIDNGKLTIKEKWLKFEEMILNRPEGTQSLSIVNC